LGFAPFAEDTQIGGVPLDFLVSDDFIEAHITVQCEMLLSLVEVALEKFR